MPDKQEQAPLMPTPDERMAEFEEPRQRAEIELQKSLGEIFRFVPLYFHPRQVDRLLMQIMKLVRKELVGPAP
jgi:hypothetical protein